MTNQIAKFDIKRIKEKREILKKVGEQLKTELFGIDDVIDRVIKSIEAWYIFPELISRPVIVNLWGMTGVGKTQLVRRLVSLLDMQQKFVEVQMDGGSMKSQYSHSSLSGILSDSSIEEGQPGILLLDEIQKFRTKDSTGNEVKLERFHDIWTLLSDGKFSSDSAVFQQMEMLFADQEYYAEYSRKRETEKVESSKKGKGKAVVVEEEKPVFQMSPWQAKNLKKSMRLAEPVREIMQWTQDKIKDVLEEFMKQKTSFEIDYTKLLIFISGNLDEAFTVSYATEDCDTNADWYHEHTKKINVTRIKRVLLNRFFPEQISRLGNNHVIYPSMSKNAYTKLIDVTCEKYIKEMEDMSGIHFVLKESVKQQIYDNSVYPTQGTRPVFSSIHMIFSSVLVNISFWCLENNITSVVMDMTKDLQFVIAESGDKKEFFPIELEINKKKAKASQDFKTYIAVHETGHALLYSFMTKSAPTEIKVNTASYTGGYMLPSMENEIATKKQIRERIRTCLAGMAAEEVVYGSELRSTGCYRDIATATSIASNYIRDYGFDTRLSKIESPATQNLQFNTEVGNSNEQIERILQEEYEITKDIITKHLDVFMMIVNNVIKNNTVNQDQFIEIMKDVMPLHTKEQNEAFHKKWRNFVGKNKKKSSVTSVKKLSLVK